MSRVVTNRLMLLSPLVIALSGCWSTTDSSVTEDNVTINNQALMDVLGVAPITVEKTQLPPADLSALRDNYADLASTVDDPSLSRQLLMRLADVEMLVAEEEQLRGDSDSQHTFERAIDTYKKTLESAEDEEYRQSALYQLSRAYDLQGNSQQSVDILYDLLETSPEPLHATEAWFRLGEAHYSNGDYAQAAQAYQKVLDAGEQDTFYSMSAYMQGWAFYKLSDYTNALPSFDRMLSASFAQAIDINGKGYLPNIDGLPKGQRKLAQDSLRVMATLFSYQGNGEAIVDYYEVHGQQPHSYLVFDELAQQHLDNDRFLDAAETYVAFANTYPLHPNAVSFFVKHIDAFILGDFPSEVMGAKAAFVKLFGPEQGVYEELSKTESSSALEQANSYLHTYLQELAQSHHSLAQTLNNSQSSTSLPEFFSTLSESEREEQARLAYASAAEYYLTFISLFGDDPLRPQMQFNLAESYFETEQFDNAIMHYEDVGYGYSDSTFANDAAYTALLSYRALLQTLAKDTDQHAHWLAQQQQSQRQFVQNFDTDVRSIAVVQTLMQDQFDANHYLEAIQYSQWLLNASAEIAHAVTPDILLSARLVQAHSHFGLKDFVAAEQDYRGLLQTLPDSHSSFHQLERNYAISIFNQAQLAVDNEKLDEAVTHLMRLMTVAPDSDVSVTAQYDAASYLIALSRFEEAQVLLLDFASRYPANTLTQDIDTKLMFVYEQTEQWQAAGDILYAQWQGDESSVEGQQALFQAAQYFQKAGNRNAALPAFRTYAHAYPDPFEQVTEARFIMSEFYRTSGEDSKRRYWLNKLILGHDRADSGGTLRSQTLAAMSAMVFADDARVAFSQIKLTMPLQSSLTKKKDALQRAIDSHNKVLAYGVREYATAANHNLATLYITLVDDLMASERPTSLSALELEQYELLLEEQAYPFEEQALSVFEANARRAWSGVYDEWVQASFEQLAALYPARYRKPEYIEELSHDMY